jgi:hypothetical protein
MLLMRFTHILGAILFVGGGFAAGLLNRLARNDAKLGPLDRAQRTMGRLADVGVLFSFLSGFLLLRLEGFDMQSFGKAGWIQIMLFLGLVGAGVNGVASGKLRRALAQDADARATRNTLSILRLVVVLAGLGAVICGVWRFYWPGHH